MLIKKLLFLIVIQSLWVNIALADNEMSSYKNGLLTIPSVSTDEQTGLYRDVIFKLTPDGLWQLTDGLIGQKITEEEVETVEIIKVNSFPVQVLLKVSGFLYSCSSTTRDIQYRLVDNNFDIVIYRPHLPPGTGCFDIKNDLKVYIPLPVYSLKKGDYTYSLNNAFFGTFSLDKDNEIEPNSISFTDAWK